MTEAEWLAATDPTPMLEFLRDKASDRKLWLFGTACMRRSLIFPDERGFMIDRLDRFFDGLMREEDRATTLTLFFHDELPDALTFVEESARVARVVASDWAHLGQAVPLLMSDGRSEGAIQADLLRDIVGNPFSAMTADPSWLTPTVLALATGIYAERGFDRLPILADALQDGGCEQDNILNHLRGAGSHTRGCWALDFVLGRA